MPRTDYTELDDAIVKSVSLGLHPAEDSWLWNIARSYANRDDPVNWHMAVIERRMQAVRKAGRIRYNKESRKWEVARDNEV